MVIALKKVDNLQQKRILVASTTIILAYLVLFSKSLFVFNEIRVRLKFSVVLEKYLENHITG